MAEQKKGPEERSGHEVADKIIEQRVSQARKEEVLEIYELVKREDVNHAS